MKLLLTSAGIANKTIADALGELTRKDPSEIKVGFVPTAANAEGDNKWWLIRDLTRLQAAGYQWIDIIDPSAAGVDWRQRLEVVDVVYIGGGNTFHLIDQVRRTGLDAWLRSAVQHKVYVGSSAGSILATPNIAIAGPYDDNLPDTADMNGLSFVDFEFAPHVGSEIRTAAISDYAKTSKLPIYAVDDETAIQVNAGCIRVATQGSWNLLNE